MNVGDFIKYFNLMCLAIIAGGIISGFFRGTKKSIFYLIFLGGFLIIGYFTMPLFQKILLKQNFFGYNAEAIIHEELIKNVPKIAPLMNENTIFMSFIDSLTTMIFRIVWIIVLLILSGTIWRFITWIFWMVFVRNKKKKMSSRLGGMLIGFATSIVVLIFVAIPFAGVSSIAKSIEDFNFKEEEQQSEVLQLSNTESPSPEDALDVLKSYHNTILGIALQKTKISNASIDERLFDNFVYLKFNGNKIKLRKEIIIIGNIISDVSNEVDLKSDKLLNEILSLDEETLMSIANDLSELKLINAIVPLGIEYFYLTEQEKLEGLALEEADYEKLLKIDYSSEFKNLSVSAIQTYKLTGFDFKNINYFNLNEEIVLAVIDNLSELELLNIVGPVGMNMLLKNDKIANIIDKETLDIKNMNFKNELSNIGKLYQAIVLLNLQTADYKKIDYASIDDDDLLNVAHRLYDLYIVQKSTPSIINYLVDNVMPLEINQYISSENINQVTWNAREVGSILLLSKLLMANNILDIDFEFQNLLTQATSRPLAKLMIESQLVSSSLTPLIKGLISEKEGDIFSEIVINDNYVWAEDELYNIFQVARLGKDLVTDEKINYEIFSFSYIDELTTAMSNSEIIMSNLTPIFTSLTQNNDMNIRLEIEEDFVWTYKEINSIFKSVKIIHSYGGEITNIFGVLDEEIDIFLSSQIITNTMIDYLYDSTLIDDELGDILVINLDKDDPIWHDSEENSGELRKIIKSLGIILGNNYNPGDDLDINRITSLSEEETTIALDSIVVSDSIINKIIDLSNKELDGMLIVRLAPNDSAWKDAQTSGELRNFLKSFQLLFGQDFNLEEPDINLDNLFNLTDPELDQLLNSSIISDSMINQIHKLSEVELAGTLFIPVDYPRYAGGWYGENGELITFIKGIREIKPADGDINNLNLDIEILYDEAKTNILLESAILRESIICNIENSENSDLVLDDLRSPNELEKFIKGAKIILPEGEIDNFVFNVSAFYSDDNLDVLLDSKVIEKSIIKHIRESQPSQNNQLIITNLEEEGELRRFFKALEIILPDGNIDQVELGVDSVYNKTDEELDTLLASLVMSDSIYHNIETSEAANSNTLDISNLRDPGELKNLIRALEIIIPNPENGIEDFVFDLSVFYSDDNLDVLLKSQVVEKSIIKHIKESEPSQNNILIVNNLEEEGELRRFFKSLEIMVPNGNLNELDLEVDRVYNKTDDELDTLLASLVMSDSIYHNIETSNVVNNGTLVITNLRDPGELKNLIRALEVLIPTPENGVNDIDFDLSLFYDDNNIDVLLESKVIEKSIIKHIKESEPSLNNQLIVTNLDEEGELRRFFKALEIILPNGNIAEVDLKVDNVYNKTDEELDTLLASLVMSDSIYHNIENSSVAINETLVITNLRDPGELKNLIRALEIIIPNPMNGINDINFETSNFFKEDEQLDIVLASKVINDSIIKRIIDSPANDILDTTDIYEDGELKHLIKALQLVLEDKPIDELEIDVDKVMVMDLDILLASKVMEKTIIKHTDPLFEEGGKLYEYIDKPEDTHWEKDYSTTPPTEGDLKPFLEAIQMMNVAGVNYKNISMEAIANSDSNNLATALLHSRIISKSISKMLNKVISDAGILYTVEDKEYEHAELVTHLNNMKDLYQILG